MGAQAPGRGNMKYHNILKDDMRNGDGLRAVLFVSGCNHYCKGCQNPVTWDANDGVDFDSKAQTELFDYVAKDYCAGMTLSGGDPLYPGNRNDITALCYAFRERFGDTKTIWLYTGYKFEEIMSEPVVQLLDVIVDGEFNEELADVHYEWAGSTNQTIWRKKDGFWYASESYEDTLNDSIRNTCDMR